MNNNVHKLFKQLPRQFKAGVIIFVFTSLVALVVYGTIQYVLRSAANDPQIQIAEDTAAALSQGADPTAVIPDSSIDIEHSIAPFVIVYDESGAVAAGTGKLNGQIPTPPAGVFDAVKTTGEDHVTWQPMASVRIAAVIVRYQGSHSGYVLAGRSLREIENRIDDEVKIICGAWLTTLIVGLFVTYLFVT